VTTPGVAVSGFPGWLRYEAPYSVTPVPATFRVAVATANVFCSTSGGVSTAATAGPGDTGALDPEDPSASCGLNPFCHIKAAMKWAFIPSESKMTEVKALDDTLASRVPFSYVAEGIAVFTANTSECDGGDGCLPQEWTIDVMGEQTELLSTEDPVYGWLLAHRGFLETVLHIGLLTPLAIWAFKAYAPAKGGE
jgi:hypothetical protein